MDKKINKSPMSGALSGVRVIDISNFLAGPISSMFLGDFGADVIKVERPGTGDEIRYWGNNKDGVGLMYKLVNRNNITPSYKMWVFKYLSNIITSSNSCAKFIKQFN